MLDKAKSFAFPLICALLSAGTVVLVKSINGSMDSIALGLVRLVAFSLDVRHLSRLAYSEIRSDPFEPLGRRHQ